MTSEITGLIEFLLNEMENKDGPDIGLVASSLWKSALNRKIISSVNYSTFISISGFASGSVERK